jgi:hypothetical protein
MELRVSLLEKDLRGISRGKGGRRRDYGWHA